MSIFVNETTKLDLNVLKGSTFTDEVTRVLAADYQDIQNRFFSKGLNVTFIHPNIKKGEKILQNVKAISQESVPWKTRIKTKAADIEIRYCETAIPQQFGGFKFLPSHIDISEPKWTYGENEMDKILVLMQTPHYKSGIIQIVDTEANETKKAEDRGRNALVEFHIYTDGGDLYNDEAKLDQFCLSWGISVKGKFESQKKNALADSIKSAEAGNAEMKADYGIEAFKNAIKDNDAFFSIRSTVQDALDKGIIKYEAKKYVVTYANGEVMMKIPVDRSGQWRKCIFEHLSKNPDKLEGIGNSNDTAPTHEPRVVDEPETITEEFIKGNTWDIHDKKRQVQKISGLGYKDLNKLKKPEIEAMLIDYYVTQGKQTP